MFTKKKWFVFLFILNFVTSQITDTGECDEKGIIVYQDLGCAPLFREGESCPYKYDCGDLTRQQGSCTFRRRLINEGHYVPPRMLKGTCHYECSCETRSSDRAPDFVCARENVCPNMPPLGPGCTWKYDVNKCCAIGQACPMFTSVPTCEVYGKQFNDGEKFYPRNSCLQCSCKKGFRGKFEHPFCRRPNCAIQIKHSKKLEQYCAPAYLNRGAQVLCCPDTWICPEGNDQIQTISLPSKPDHSLTCKYGNTLLQLGQGFQREVTQNNVTHRVLCECVLPPLLTCKSL